MNVVMATTGAGLIMLLVFILAIALCYFMWIGLEDILAYFGINFTILLVIGYIMLWILSMFVPGWGFVNLFISVIGILDYFHIANLIK